MTHRDLPSALVRKRLAVLVAGALAGGWLASAAALPFAADPASDPTKPSNQPAAPLPPGSDDASKADSLKLGAERAKGQAKPACLDNTHANGPTITLKAITFEGNTESIVSSAELQALAVPCQGAYPITVDGNALEALRHRATMLYVGNGYITSGAVIEDEDIKAARKTGALRVLLVEGKLVRVEVKDDTDAASKDDWFSRLWPFRGDYVQDRLLGDAGQPLKTEDLEERYRLLLNDPLIERLNGTLMPSLKRGDAVLDLQVVRARPYGAYLGADNYSPPSVGGYAGRMGAWAGNLTGFGERVDFNFVATGGANNYNTSLLVPLSARGTQFAFRYTNSANLLIEPPFNTLDIHSNIIGYDGEISHPLLRALRQGMAQTITVGLNFNVRQDTTTIAGQPLNRPGADNGETQETVVRAWQDYKRQERDFDLALRSTFSVGVNALGATITSQVGDGRFFNWLGQGTGIYRLPKSLPKLFEEAYFSLNAAVQVSDDQLLPLEKLAIGGSNTVRGYRQNYLVRDEGFYTALEFHYPLYPNAGWRGRGPSNGCHLWLVPFFDYGGAWDYRQSATYISSAGVGLDWQYDGIKGSLFDASVYWAGRFNHYVLPAGTPYDLQDNGVTFQVKWQSK